MAEGKDSGLKDLENEITCAICHDFYTEPKVLSCCHYYCKQCIRSLALRTGLDKPFSCPECRKDTILPQSSVDNLQGAFFINRMKEVHSKLQRATGSVEAKCEICSEDKSEAFCRQCAQFICAECVKSHKRLAKLFPGHKIVTCEELKEGGAKEILTQEHALQMCKTHEQPMNIYCFDCGCLICRDCTIKDHRDHSYEFIKKAAPETKKMLIQHLNPLRERKSSLSCAVNDIQTTRSDVEAQGHSVARDIESSFDELHQIIEHRKQQLLAEAAKNMTCKMDSLSGQEKSLSTACAVVQSVIDYTEQCIEHSADDELMCMHTELQSRIDREIEEQQKEEENLEPVEEVDMAAEVSCVEELKQLCQTKANITQLPIDPSKCTVTGKGTVSADVGEMSHVTVTTNLPNGKPTKKKCTIKCHLRLLADRSTTECKVERIEGSEYRIQYTPTVRGRHELTVTVNGVEVAGSPFPVFVSIHPKKLGKPVRVITGLDHPSDVAINSEGELIVSEYMGDVVTVNKKGNRLRSIKSSDYKFHSPTGIAIDRDDNLYFIMHRASIIWKSDKDMKSVKKYTAKMTGGRFCVTIVGDQVIVCRNGTIELYNKKLDYIREITPCGKIYAGKFEGISSDERGTLYVSDGYNSCVHVISNDGELLRSFGSDESGVKKLNYPIGICVADQYVYVGNDKNHNVSVFTTSGEYVTSFGQKGFEKGDFDRPWGMCVDEDGYICVCDFYNCRVQLF